MVAADVDIPAFVGDSVDSEPAAKCVDAGIAFATFSCPVLSCTLKKQHTFKRSLAAANLKL